MDSVQSEDSLACTIIFLVIAGIICVISCFLIWSQAIQSLKIAGKLKRPATSSPIESPLYKSSNSHAVNGESVKSNQQHLLYAQLYDSETHTTTAGGYSENHSDMEQQCSFAAHFVGTCSHKTELEGAAFKGYFFIVLFLACISKFYSINTDT